MAETINANVVIQLTDKGAFAIVDSFGNTNDNVGILLQTFLNFG